jgi:stearoyl-CoA desaturase (delta-9 desaturase)
VRIFLVHHITWSINSICHFFGRRRFETDDESTNVFWLALPSLGEAWHHNHHAFPQSAFHGLRWYEFDPSGWLILAMARVGLAWDVIRVTPERAQAKLAGAISKPVAAANGVVSGLGSGITDAVSGLEGGAEASERRPAVPNPTS